MDRCPGDSEDVDGFEDGDGCPEFDNDQDGIPDARDQCPNVQILVLQVEGHTDTDGPDDYNLDLSQRRADSVSKFLVEKGVEAGRLRAKGFGETKPIASNKTAAGRATNRRVQFMIIEPSQDTCR